MNYVSVFMVAVALFATIYWYVSGRNYYVGPRVNAQIIVGVSGGDDKISPSASSDGKRGELDGMQKATELPGHGKSELSGQGKSELDA